MLISLCSRALHTHDITTNAPGLSLSLSHNVMVVSSEAESAQDQTKNEMRTFYLTFDLSLLNSHLLSSADRGGGGGGGEADSTTEDMSFTKVSSRRKYV